MSKSLIYKTIKFALIFGVLIIFRVNASEVIDYRNSNQIVPIIMDERNDLASSLFIHKEPEYSEIKSKIINRESFEEEMMIFRFVENPKCLIIGDSRVCGLRKINYGEHTDLIGISGAASYNINDIAENLVDYYYDEIIAWFSVNDYNALDNIASISDISEIEQKINHEIFNTMSTLSKKTKGKVYYIRNSLGKNVSKYNIKNRIFSEVENELNRNEKYVLLDTVIDADSPYCYDGTHYTLEGSIMIMYGARWQIEKIYKEEVKNGKES